MIVGGNEREYLHALEEVWKWIDNESKGHFWTRLSAKIGADPDIRNELSNLLAAVEATSKRRPLKPNAAARRRVLSSNDLRTQTGRLKERLFRTEDCWWSAGLRSILAHSLKDAYLPEIKKFLVAFNVPHREDGLRIRGAPRLVAPDSEIVAQLVESLQQETDAKRLAIALVLLVSSGADWQFLLAHASKFLEPLSSNALQPPLPEIGEQAKTQKHDHLDTPSSSIESFEFTALAEAINSLIDRIAVLLPQFSELSLPAEVALALPQKKVKQELHSLDSALRASRASLEALELAMASQIANAPAIALLTRLRSVRHLTNPTFAGTEQVRDKCDAILLDGPPSSLDAPKLAPFVALEALIVSQNTLSDEQLGQSNELVGKHFGWAVASAATSSRLSLSSPPSEGSQANWEHPAGSLKSAEKEIEQPIEVSGGPKIIALSESPARESQLLLTEERSEGNFAADSSKSANPQNEMQRAEPIRFEEDTPGTSSTIEQASIAHPSETPNSHSLPPSLPPQQSVPIPDFDSFCRTSWINAEGKIEPAPWNASSYYDQLKDAGVSALENYDYATAYLLFIASSTGGVEPPLLTSDLELAASILEGKSLQTSDLTRETRLVQNFQSGFDSPGNRLALTLIALQPTPSHVLNPADEEQICSFVHFRDGQLTKLMAGLLREQRSGRDPVEAVIVAQESERFLDRSALEGRLAADRKRLRNEIAQLWSAAGGRIERTHCRLAWKKFVDHEIGPLRDIIIASLDDPKAYRNWDLLKLDLLHRNLLSNFREIMQDGEVRDADRKTADKTAQKLSTDIGAILGTARLLQRQRNTQSKEFGKLSIQAAHYLADCARLSDPVDELCRQIVLGAAKLEPQETSILRIRGALFVENLDLLRLLPSLPAPLSSLATIGVLPSAFPDAVAAAAYIKESGSSEVEEVAESDFQELLRKRLLDSERPELLAALSQAQILDPVVRTKLHREADVLGAQAYKSSEQLRQLWHCIELLLAPEAAGLHAVSDEARRLTEERVPLPTISQTLFVQSWIDQLLLRAEKIKERVLDQYAQLIGTRSPDLLQEFRQAKLQKEFRRIPHLAGKTKIEAGDDERQGLRRTRWRKKAEREFTQPIKYIAELSAGEGSALAVLASAWTTRTQADPKEANRRLRQAFFSFVSGDQESFGQQKKPRNVELRSLENTRVTVDCNLVRKLFRDQRMNPSFLPQLKQYQKIVIAVAPFNRAAGGGRTSHWVRSISDQSEANDLVVLLAPGVAGTERAEVLRDFRARKLSAALIDDIDICRLVSLQDARGHDFVPFLEIVLEQLAIDLHKVSPFAQVDGQHSPIEMFVGRAQDAEALALGATYTRVFSGRKLGKSAMLKSIELNYDHAQLPSTMKLHVIFINIAGFDSEMNVVGRIIQELQRRFPQVQHNSDSALNAADRLSSYIAALIAVRAHDSILVILDEADTFIEAQLQEQVHHPEGTLSFRMMKEMSSSVDSAAIPRVRVVFSGYRKTNTRDGVWANAGAILTLRPLEASEAALFMEGALARIGIDIGELAPYVAARCGYQPAVLIAFGTSLLNRLRRTRSDSERESIVVSEDDVIETFNDAPVQHEIRTVVNNNFQFNPEGQAIFTATLLAMKDLAPGYMLEQGAEQVLAKLTDIDGIDWLEQIDPAPMAEIERNLQDFIDRELLVSDEDRFSERTYRLRFPHFLPVLTQQPDLPQLVRQAIGLIRATPVAKGVGGSILPPSGLETARYWFSEGTSDICKVVVVAGPWTAPIESATVGVANRLGIPSERVVNCRSTTKLAAALRGGLRAFTNPSLDQAQELLSSQSSKPILVTGDLATLRQWLLLQAEGAPVEVIGMRHLAPQAIAWWFETARALHFPSVSTVDRFVKASLGCPLLASLLDAVLRQDPGSDVTQAEFDAAMVSFVGRRLECFRSLAKKERSGLLLARERELILMVGLLAKSGIGTFDLGEEFSSNWQLVKDTGEIWSEFAPPYAGVDDANLLRFLELSGLLVVKDGGRGSRRVEEGTDGFVAQLIDAMEP